LISKFENCRDSGVGEGVLEGVDETEGEAEVEGETEAEGEVEAAGDGVDVGMVDT
jgi:hypothetical protein